jgi:hypothetical protein
MHHRRSLKYIYVIKKMTETRSIDVTIVTDTELSVMFGSKKYEKYVSLSGGPKEHFSRIELIDIGTVLAQSDEMKQAFPVQHDRLRKIMFAGTHLPGRKEIAIALLAIMKQWNEACQNEEDRPMPRKYREDKRIMNLLQRTRINEINRSLDKIESLQRQIEDKRKTPVQQSTTLLAKDLQDLQQTMDKNAVGPIYSKL